MAVKHSHRGSEISLNPHPGVPVWLIGWPLAIPSAGVAVVAALLAVPRATEPRSVPQPAVHVRELNDELAELERLARIAHDQPLPFTIREVGEAYRRLGRAQFEGPQLLDDAGATGLHALARAAHTKLGDGPLLGLRAVQVQIFVKSLQIWEETCKVPDDLVELGGDFVGLAQKNRWWVNGHLRMSAEQRWAMGILRWTTLTGLLTARPFRVPHNLEVIETRFFFEHGASTPNLQQRIVKRYSELEPDYPLAYARGVLAAEQGQYELAAANFARQLQTHPDGSYATRARNHLIWVTAQMHALENGVEAR